MENKKQNEKAGGNMKGKVMEYLRVYWGKKVFKKSVSLLVAVCFILNLANLPVFAQSSRTSEEMKRKEINIEEKQKNVVTNPIAVKPVNEQIGGVANIKADIGEAAKREWDRKDITVTAVGAILERSRDGKQENIIGSIDEKGKAQIFSADSSRPFSKKAEDEYVYRTEQVLESGVKSGQYVETHSKEYMSLEQNRQVLEKKQENREITKGDNQTNQESKVKEKDEKVLSEGIKDKDIEQSVQKEQKQVVHKQNIDEQSVQEKQNALRALIKDKDTASVTKATIAKVKENAKKIGLNLVAEKNNDETQTKIELYSSKYTGENVFVGKSAGMIAYASPNGSVEVREAKKTIIIAGNEFESTGISLVRAAVEQEDNKMINKTAEGLFFAELFGIYDKKISNEQITKVREGLQVKEGKGVSAGKIGKYMEDKAGLGLSARIVNSVKETINNRGLIVSDSAQSIKKVFDQSNKGVLVFQSMISKASIRVAGGKKAAVLSEKKAEDAAVQDKSVKEKAAKKEDVKKADSKEEKLEDTKAYANVLKKMREDTGQTEEEVKKALEGISAEQLSVLNDFYKEKNATIVNCATEALENVLKAGLNPGEGISKGMLALQALAVDIASGVFGKESVKDGQINTSMTAMNQVLKDNGSESSGYGISLNEFKDGLKLGESGILWVDGNHFITVTKEEEGKFSIEDPNKNNGGKIRYSSDEFEKLLSGEEAKGVDASGKDVTEKGYSVDTNDMKVLTNSQGIEEKAAEGKARVLDKAETDEITGAKYVTSTVTRTKTETRTGTRTESREGTRSYTDYDGETHTESYSYDVDVEYTYEVEVEYQETVTTWVADSEGDKEQEAKAAEERKVAAEMERAKKEAEEARAAAEKEKIMAQVAINNLEAEVKARQKAESGENVRDVKEVSVQEAQEEKAAFDTKVESMENDVVVKTVEAHASAEKSAEKSADAEVLVQNNFDNVKAENSSEEVQKAAQNELDQAKKQTETAKDNVEARTQDFINLVGEENAELLAGVDKEKLSGAIGYLNNIIKNGGDIVNCAADALSNVIGGGVSKALLAVQAIAIDIASGAFFKNNDINDKDAGQVMVSMDAMSKMLKDSGDYKGHLVGGIEGVNEGLNNGGVILNVNIKDENGKDMGHYVSMNTDDKGNVTIKDTNKEDKIITKEQIDLAKTQGKDALSDYLKDTYDWQGGAMLATGEIKTGTEMTQQDMEDTAGAAKKSGSNKSSSSKSSSNKSSSNKSSSNKSSSNKSGSNKSSSNKSSSNKSSSNKSSSSKSSSSKKSNTPTSTKKPYGPSAPTYSSKKPTTTPTANKKPYTPSYTPYASPSVAKPYGPSAPTYSSKKPTTTPTANKKPYTPSYTPYASPSVAKPYGPSAPTYSSKKPSVASTVNKPYKPNATISSSKKPAAVTSKKPQTAQGTQKKSGGVLGWINNNIVQPVQKKVGEVVTDVKQGVNTVVSKVDNWAADVNLTSKQNAAQRAAATGTQAQQDKANSKLTAAETNATRASTNLSNATQAQAQTQASRGNTTKSVQLNNQATTTRNNTQTKIGTGQVSVAQTSETRARNDYNTALSGSDQKTIDNTRQTYIDKSENTGAVADRNVAEMNASGNTAGASKVRQKALNGVQYGGTTKDDSTKPNNGTIAQTKKNDATVKAAKTQSTQSVTEFNNSKKDKESDIDAIGTKTSADAQAVVDAMNATGNGDKAPGFLEDWKTSVGHNGVYDPASDKKKASDYMAEVVTEVKSERSVNASTQTFSDKKTAYENANQNLQNAYKTGSKEDIATATAAQNTAEQEYKDASGQVGKDMDVYKSAAEATGNQDTYQSKEKTVNEAVGNDGMQSDKPISKQIESATNVKVAENNLNNNDSRRTRANTDYRSAVNSGNGVDEAKKEYIDSNAAYGKSVDVLADVYTDAGKEAKAEAIKAKAVEGLPYTGDGKTTEEKLRNNATVDAAIIQSDKSIEDYKNAVGDDKKDLGSAADKAGADADAVVKAMQDTGNSDKVEDYVKSLKKNLDHNGEYDAQKKASEYVQESARETETQRGVETAQDAYDTSKTAYESARDAYETDPTNTAKQQAYEEAKSAYLGSADDLGTAMGEYETATEATGNQAKSDKKKEALGLPAVGEDKGISTADQIKNDAKITVQDGDITIEKAKLNAKIESYGTDGVEAANKAFDDYLAGDLTLEEYQAKINELSGGRQDISDSAAAIDSMIDDLSGMKNEAGYAGDDAKVPAKVSDQTNKDLRTADEKKQDYVVEQSEKAGNEYAEALKDITDPEGGLTDTSAKDLEKYQEKYQRSLGALGAVTDNLNNTYDVTYATPEQAQAAKKTRASNIAPKVEATQIKVNDALTEAMKSTHSAMRDSDVTETALAQLGDLWNVISQAGKPIMDALTDFSIKLYGDTSSKLTDLGYIASLTSQGITVNNGVVLQNGFNQNGEPIIRTIILTKSESDAEIRKIIATQDLDAGINYAKSQGLYSSEGLYDKDFNTIYFAKAVGYTPGDANNPPQIAIEYSFSSAYTDDVYFDCQDGERKILTESFDKEGNVTEGVVYEANTVSPNGSMGYPPHEDTRAINTYTTDSGLVINTQSATIGAVERVTGWSRSEEGDRVADTVEFKDGKPSAFETSVVKYVGTQRIVVGERHDLRNAVTYPDTVQKEEGSGGTDEPTIVDKYADILNRAAGMKIGGQDDLYKSFDLVSNDYIDAGKIQTLGINSVNGPSLDTSYVDAATGRTVTIQVEAGKNEQGEQIGIIYDEGTSWRDTWSLGTGDKSNGVATAYDPATGEVVVEAFGITFNDPNDIKNYTLPKEGIKYYEQGETTTNGNTETIRTRSTTNVTVGDEHNIASVNGTFDVPSANTVFETNITRNSAGKTISTRTVEIENVTIADDGTYDPNEEISNRYTRGYDANNNLEFAKDSYAGGAKVSPVVTAREYGSSIVDPLLGADYIELDGRTDFEWTNDPNGAGLILKTDVKVNGTFYHANLGNDGKPVIGEDGKPIMSSGKLQDATYKAGQSGVSVLHGEVVLDSNTIFRINKGGGEGGGDLPGSSSNELPDSKTNAVVVETEEDFTVSGGVLSIRDGAFVVMGKGSQFKIGSDIIGLGKITEGSAIFDGTLDEYGNKVFKQSDGTTLKIAGKDGLNYSVDSNGVKTQIFSTADTNLLINSNQRVVEVEGKQYIVNVEDGKDSAGGWLDKANNDYYVDGQWYDVSKLQEIVEILDADGNGTGFHIGAYNNQMVEGSKAGWSADDDISVSLDGKTYAIDVDGRFTARALPSDIKATVSSSYIDEGKPFEVSISDFRGNSSDKLRAINIGGDSTLYVPTSALAGKTEMYSIPVEGDVPIEISIEHQSSGNSKISINGEGIDYTNVSQVTGNARGHSYSYEQITNLLDGEKHTILSGNDNTPSLAVEFKNGSITLHRGQGNVIDNVTKYDYYANGAGKLTQFTDFEKDSQGDNRFSVNSRAWDSDNNTVMTESMSAIWSGNMKEVGRATELTITEDRPGNRTYFDTDGNITSHTEFYGKLTNIEYEKSSIKSFKPENYTETTTNRDGTVEKVTYDGYASDSKITYKIIDNVSYLEDIQSVTKTTQTGSGSVLNGEAASGKSLSERLGAITYFDGTKVEDIKVLDQTVKKTNVSYVDPKTQQSITMKVITTTTHEQIIESIITSERGVEVRTRSELETPAVRSVIFDKQNRAILETQSGGIFKTTAMNTVAGMNGSDGINEGDTLHHGKTDKIVSYNYNDDGSVETNSVEHRYNYMTDPVFAKTFGEDAANGSVEVVITNRSGNILTTETVESMVYGLDDNADLDQRKMNTDAKFAHTSSFSQSMSLQGTDIPEKTFGSKDEMLDFIRTLGDDELNGAAENMTKEQLEVMLRCDNYTLYSSKADFIANTVTIDTHAAVTKEYGPNGQVSNITSSGESYKYSLNEESVDGYVMTDVAKVQNINFSAYSINTNKAAVDSAAQAMSANSVKVNSMIRADMLNSTNDILGVLQSHSAYERVESNFVYDDLGRLISNDFDETVNGQRYTGTTETIYTNNGPNSMASAVTTLHKTAVDENGNVIAVLEPDTQDMVSFGHSHLGQTGVIDVNLTAVNMYDEIGFARDSQIYKRDELRNTIIAAVVTAAYIAATVVLAVVTFGASTLIQVSVQSAIMVALAIAAIPAVYKGTKAAADAASVGDTSTALMQAAFVALEFTMVLGPLAKAFGWGAKIAQGIGKLGKAGQALTAAGKAVSKFVANAKKVLSVVSPTKLLNIAKPLAAFGEKLIAKGAGWAIAGNILKSKALGIAANIVVSMGRNYVTFELVGSKVLGALGIEKGSATYNAIMAIYIAAPIFDKSLKRSGADGSGLKITNKDDVLKAGVKSRRDGFFKTLATEVSGTYVEKGLVRSIGSGIKEGFKQVGRNFAESFKGAWNTFLQNSLGVTQKGFFKEHFTRGFSHGLKTGLGLLDNFIATSLANSAGMMADITKFNLFVMQGGGGAVNSIIKNTTGKSLGEYFGISLFENIPVFSSLEDMGETLLISSAETMTSKSMIGFSFITPLASVVAGPLLQNLPFIGRAARFMSEFDGFFNTSNAQSKQWQNTFFEENIKEELLGSVFDFLPMDKGLKEALKECFDPSGSPDMTANYDTALMTSAAAMNTLTTNNTSASASTNRVDAMQTLRSNVTESLSLTSTSNLRNLDTRAPLTRTQINEAVLRDVVDSRFADRKMTPSEGTRQAAYGQAEALNGRGYSIGASADVVTRGVIPVLQTESAGRSQADTGTYRTDFSEMDINQVAEYISAVSVVQQNFGTGNGVKTSFDAASLRLAQLSTQENIRNMDNTQLSDYLVAASAVQKQSPFAAVLANAGSQSANTKKNPLLASVVNTGIFNRSASFGLAFKIQSGMETATLQLASVVEQSTTIMDGALSQSIPAQDMEDVKHLAQQYAGGNAEIVNQSKELITKYFLTDVQLARISDMSESEIERHLQVNLATSALADGVLFKSMQDVVKQQIGDAKFDELSNAIIAVSQLKELQSAGDSVSQQAIDELTSKIKGLKEGLDIPYAVEAAVFGFRAGQKDAFRDILQSTIENGGQSLDVAGYAHKIQTAAGKTIMGLFTILALRGNPHIENRDSKFITWLTNEDSNAEDLKKHIDLVFGSKLGNVETISQANVQEWQKDGSLRSRLENAHVVIGTYSGWSSLFSETMAGLVSFSDNADAEQVKFNQALLKDANIELVETTLEGGKKKYQFADAKDTPKAIKLLVEYGQGLEKVNLPLERISQLVGDELDYAATIPASALASAAGKYSQQYALADYYGKLSSGEKVDYADYAHVGITEEQAIGDMKAKPESFKATAKTYEDISSLVSENYDDGRDAVTSALNAFEAKAANKIRLQEAGITSETLKTIIDTQFENLRNLEVRQKLLRSLADDGSISSVASDKLSDGDIEIFFAEYTNADGETVKLTLRDLAEFSEGDKGARNISEDGVYTSVAAEQQAADYSNVMAKAVEGITNSVHEQEIESAKSEQQNQEVAAKTVSDFSREQFDAMIDNLVEQVYAEYGDIFSSKLAARETILTAVDALAMYNAKQAGVGTGGYMVEPSASDPSRAESIYITSNGTPMKNLNMPGMWAIELMEGCSSINKPSIETFIASKEALAAFQWAIGFSGTFSSSVSNLLKGLNYMQVGGSMADTMKVDVSSVLVRDQSSIAKIIAESRKSVNAKGIAAVDLILTASFDGTTQMFNQLVDELAQQIMEKDSTITLDIARTKASESIVSLSLDSLDSELAKLSDSGKYKTADVAGVMKEFAITDNYDTEKLKDINTQDKIRVLQEVLKKVAKSGEVSFIIGDVSLCGRGWNPGEMDGAVDSLKETQGHTDASSKVQATMWKVNFEKMDSTQSEQGDGRFAHRDDQSRFSRKHFNRDIIQITSVDSVRENKILRDAAIANGDAYSVNMILDNLNAVMEANEEATLSKANNMVVNEFKNWRESKTSQKTEAPTVAAARQNLERVLTGPETAFASERKAAAETASDMLNKILTTAKVRQSEDAALSPEAWYAYENFLAYAAAAESLGIENVQDISRGQLGTVISGDAVGTMRVLREKTTSSTTEIDKLLETATWLEGNYDSMRRKISEVQSGMSKEDREELQSRPKEIAQEKGIRKVIDTMKFNKKFKGITSVSAELQKGVKAFETANASVFTMDEFSGFKFNQETGAITLTSIDTESPVAAVPAIQPSVADSDTAVATPQEPQVEAPIVQQPTATTSSQSSIPSVPAAASNIPTPMDVVGQFGMGAIIGGVNDLLNVNGIFGIFDINSNSIESILKGCTAEALMIMGRLGTIESLSEFIAEALLSQEKVEGNVVGLLKAAGGEKGSEAVAIKAMAKAGKLKIRIVSEEEMEELYVPKSGIAAYMKGKEGSAGHVVVIKEISEGKVGYIDLGERKEASIEEFKVMGFEGIVMVSRYAQKKNNEILRVMGSSSEEVKKYYGAEQGTEIGDKREYVGGRKLGDLIINGVMEAGELSKAVLYVLNIWKDAGEMAETLGVSMEEVRGEEGIEKITQGYYKKVSEVLEAGEEILSPGEVMAEVKLLSTVRDMLITINKDNSGRMESLLSEAKLGEEEVSEIMSRMIESKAVNHRVMIGGMEKAKREVGQTRGEEEINVERLKRAVEEKKSVREKFAGKFFGRNAKLEEVLPSLGSGTFVETRGAMTSPLMARMLAQAA